MSGPWVYAAAYATICLAVSCLGLWMTRTCTGDEKRSEMRIYAVGILVGLVALATSLTRLLLFASS